MNPGIASRGSPMVSSIGLACPAGMPSSSRRSCVNGDRIWPLVKAARSNCEDMRFQVLSASCRGPEVARKRGSVYGEVAT